MSKLILHNAAASPSGLSNDRLANATQGTGVIASDAVATSAGPATTQYAKTVGFPQLLTWLSPPVAAVTLSSTATFNLWSVESGMNANVGLRCLVEHCDSAGNVIDTIIDSTRGTEMGTTMAVNNWTGTITSHAIPAGDRIRITVFFTDTGGTQSSGFTSTLDYDAGAGVDGDSYVNFTQALTFVTGAVRDVGTRFRESVRNFDNVASRFKLGGATSYRDIASRLGLRSTAPLVASITDSAFGSATTSHLVSMPPVVIAGDVLLAVMVAERVPGGATTINTPSGWFAYSAVTLQTDIVARVFAKLATGSEGGTTVDFTVDGTGARLAAQVFRIRYAAKHGPATDLAPSSWGSNSSNSVTFSTASPSWGTGLSTLWIELWATSGGGSAATASSSGYGLYHDLLASVTGPRIATAYRDAAASSESPGAVSLAASTQWYSMAIGVAPFRSLDVATRFRLFGRTVDDVATRFRVARTGSRDVATRARITAQRVRDVGTRFRLPNPGTKDVASRFEIMVRNTRDVGTRAMVVARNTRDVATRFVITSATGATKDVGSRFRASVRVVRDVATRLRFVAQTARDVGTRARVVVAAARDAATRLRVTAPSTRDVATRFRETAQRIRDVPSRFALLMPSWAQTIYFGGATDVVDGATSDAASYLQASAGVVFQLFANVGTRFAISSATGVTRDVATRARVTARSIRDVGTRFREVVARAADVGTRLRFTAAAARDVGTRLRLSVAGSRDVATRYRVTARSARDVATRYRVLAPKYVATRYRLAVAAARDAGTRLRLVGPGARDVGTRFRQTAAAARDVATRFRVLQPRYVATRFRLWAARTADVGSRYRLTAARTIDVGTRFRITSTVTTAWRDVATRLRLAAASARDVPTRFRLAVSGARDVGTRARLVAPGIRDVGTRLRLNARRAIDVGTRYRLVVARAADVGTRYAIAARSIRDVGTRFRVLAPKYVATRFRLAVSGSRDVGTRIVLRAAAARDAATRLRITVAGSRDAGTRFRLWAARTADVGTRYVLRGARTADAATRLSLVVLRRIDVGTRYRLLGITARDAATRFGLTSVIARDVATRAVVTAGSSRDAATRFRLSSAGIRDVATRARLTAVGSRDVATRALVSARAYSDVATRFGMAQATARDVATRFRLSTPTRLYLRDIISALAPTLGSHSAALPVGGGASNSGATYESLSLLSHRGALQVTRTVTAVPTAAHQDQYVARFTGEPLADGNVPAQDWTVGIALSEADASADSYLVISFYIWRPSTSSVVGYIRDSDAPLGGEWDPAERGIVATFAGAAVAGQEDDVPVVEVWRHKAAA